MGSNVALYEKKTAIVCKSDGECGSASNSCCRANCSPDAGRVCNSPQLYTSTSINNSMIACFRKVANAFMNTNMNYAVLAVLRQQQLLKFIPILLCIYSQASEHQSSCCCREHLFNRMQYKQRLTECLIQWCSPEAKYQQH